VQLNAICGASISLVAEVIAVAAQGDWAHALQDLELAEESFDVCKADLIKSVDNIGCLLLDSVW
jgi:hypothetical protein